MLVNRAERQTSLRSDAVGRSHGRGDVFNVPMLDSAEDQLIVSFEGITETEARAALSGFPGGSRFRLRQTH